MEIGHNSISNQYMPMGDASSSKQSNTASFSDAMHAAQNQMTVEAESNTKPTNSVLLDTNQGKIGLDIEEYLTPSPQAGPIDLMSVPLLLPTEHNINALSQYSENAFRDLLSQYNIPSPPANIEFDAEGKLILPAEYPHAAELRQALNENPGVEKALSTLSALASHYAGIMEGAAFRDEMATARNRADEERIVQKYAYLFDDNRPGAQIVLSFLNDGSLLVGKKGGEALS